MSGKQENVQKDNRLIFLYPNSQKPLELFCFRFEIQIPVKVH